MKKTMLGLIVLNLAVSTATLSAMLIGVKQVNDQVEDIRAKTKSALKKVARSIEDVEI